MTQRTLDFQKSMTSSALSADKLSDVNRVEQLQLRKSALSHASHLSATPTIEDSSKLTYQLSRELALLHGLTLGLGGESDSDKLREELRLSRFRACSLALQNHPFLLPLMKSRSSLKKDVVSEVEKLYRIYSGCLEYLVHLMHKVRFLLLTFDIHSETCLLIQTGITDSVGFVHRTACSQREVNLLSASQEGTHIYATQGAHEEESKLVGDMEAMQDLLYNVTSACDIQPWDVGEDGHDWQPPTHNPSVTKFHLRSPSRKWHPMRRSLVYNDDVNPKTTGTYRKSTDRDSLSDVSAKALPNPRVSALTGPAADPLPSPLQAQRNQFRDSSLSRRSSKFSQTSRRSSRNVEEVDGRVSEPDRAKGKRKSRKSKKGDRNRSTSTSSSSSSSSPSSSGCEWLRMFCGCLEQKETQEAAADKRA